MPRDYQAKVLPYITSNQQINFYMNLYRHPNKHGSSINSLQNQWRTIPNSGKTLWELTDACIESQTAKRRYTAEQPWSPATAVNEEDIGWRIVELRLQCLRIKPTSNSAWVKDGQRIFNPKTEKKYCSLRLPATSMPAKHSRNLAAKLPQGTNLVQWILQASGLWLFYHFNKKCRDAAWWHESTQS